MLLIGDEALTGLREPFAPHRTDLAEVWTRAHRPPDGLRGVGGGRRGDRTGAGARWPSWRGCSPTRAPTTSPTRRRWSGRRAARFPFPAEFIRPYLRRLRYEFGPAERAGLEAFLTLAAQNGELDVVPAAGGVGSGT